MKMILVDGRGGERFCALKISDEEPYSIEIESSEFVGQKLQGSDLFDCLIKVRLYLEQKGYLLLCNGARIDVYPSGMSREMSGGRLAYLTKIGIGASRDDIVDIFEQSQTNVGTVEQQKEFHTRWVDSIKSH